MSKAAKNTPETPSTVEGPAPAPRKAPVKGKSVAIHKPQPPAAPPVPLADDMAMMQIMERMSANKDVDTAKLGQIREFAEAMLADRRRAAFDTAFAEMQADLPTITANGTIEIRAKGAGGERDGKVLQSTKYAKWDDINQAIKPVLKKHGFGLRFETGLASDGRVMVTGILSGHGHRESSVFVLPHDSTGSKNAVQAIGSSTSYGKRYAACALLNITSHGEDDDASSADITIDERPKVSQSQIEALIELCDAKGCPRDKFLKHIKVDSFAAIPAVDFEDNVHLLNTYQKK